MKKLKIIFTTRTGLRSIFFIVMGLLIASIVANHLPNENFSTVVIILGSGLALVGTQSLIEMIAVLNHSEIENEKK